MVETANGMFEIVKDENNCFVIADFDARYVELFGKYEFIVGDYSQNILRLKGFNKEDAKSIPDYVNEYCSIDCQYYVLRNPNFNKHLVIPED
ncbi:MAG: DUF1027 domain-containing protein [Bacillales bacterium]|nr:DUF1027 domain-containing protein [Bacillales bacterium]